MILQALASDHEALTQLTKLSKAHWGYSPAQMEAWAEVLTISEMYITNNLVYKKVENDLLVGYYSLIPQTTHTIQLDNLFIHPAAMGKGYGSLLLADALKRVKQAGDATMTLDADPHAETFYLGKGFVVVGQLETSIPKRYLPVMELDFFRGN